MSSLRALLSRIRGLFGRSTSDRDLADEFPAHLDMAAAEYERRALEPAEARRRARLDAGSLEVAAEAYRHQRGLPGLDTVLLQRLQVKDQDRLVLLRGRGSRSARGAAAPVAATARRRRSSTSRQAARDAPRR